MENQSENIHQNNNADDQIQVESSIQQTFDTGSAVVPGRDNDRKIFIGGLSASTTENDLRSYFSKFGTIESVNIKLDHDTRNSKGFGFVVFNTVDCITQVTAVREHIINKKKVDVQIAKMRTGKIFVGGITTDMTDEDIKSYFGQFGNVVGVEMPFDKTKNQRKNFCFVIFESAEQAREVLKNPKHTIKNKQVDIKRVEVKPNQGDGQNKFPRRNTVTFGQNWNQSYDNQAYGGYGLNNPQGFGSMYGGYDTGYIGYGTYGSVGYDQNAIRNYGTTTGRGANRGGRGMNRGGVRSSRGRGNRFQPF